MEEEEEAAEKTELKVPQKCPGVRRGEELKKEVQFTYGEAKYGHQEKPLVLTTQIWSIISTMFFVEQDT